MAVMIVIIVWCVKRAGRFAERPSSVGGEARRAAIVVGRR